MSSRNKITFDLLELIDEQDKVIKKQNEIIIKITNENAEKESLINEISKMEEHLL